MRGDHGCVSPRKNGTVQPGMLAYSFHDLLEEALLTVGSEGKELLGTQGEWAVTSKAQVSGLPELVARTKVLSAF